MWEPTNGSQHQVCHILVTEAHALLQNNLDSLVYPNLFYPQACQQQNVGALNSTFFQSGWRTYTG